MRDWPPPSNVRELWSILGLVSNNQRSTETLPPSPARCIDRRSEVSTALLPFPDSQQPFILDSNASNVLCHMPRAAGCHPWVSPLQFLLRTYHASLTWL